MTSRILTLIILLGICFAGEVDPKANPVVEKAVSAALADGQKAYEAYRAALAKASEKAIKDLERAKADAMKRGDLPSANELDGKIKELREGGLESIISKRQKTDDLLGENAALTPKLILGSWTAQFSDGYAGKHVFAEGGGATNESNIGTWKIDGAKLVVTWSKGGYVEKYDLQPREGKLIGVSNTGNRTVTLIRN
jgi:hypothetical protein